MSTREENSRNTPEGTQLSFRRTDGPLDRAVDDLMLLAGGIHNGEIVREMIVAALKAGQEDQGRADLKLMSMSLKEMRYTSKVFGPYRDVRKVTVFGSARTLPQEAIYQMARDFGKRLADGGYMVITGAGPGIMHAVNEGAGAENSFGVNIRLPFEQKPNPILEGLPRHINYKYFFNRKVAFVKESDAVALFPGGFGTLDEAMEILTLVQTGKRNPVPIVMVDLPGGTYWRRWEGFVKEELLTRGAVSPSDLSLFALFDSAEEAVRSILGFYGRYHSLRYVGPKTVIRLKSLPAVSVGDLEKDFQDILSPGGGMAFSGPLPEEHDEPESLPFHRLVVDFNRREFGRLRELIDLLND